MIDFHSHFLPEIDDGSDSLETSLAMLRESYRQGVDLMCATPHFYADEDDPTRFLRRRNAAWDRLRSAIGDEAGFPKVGLGAEILYFPGISVADEIRQLVLEGTPFLLIEPPMIPWSNAMLDEIELCGKTLRCVPVIAHIDRYMRLLRDRTLFDRVKERRVLIQVNASFFLHASSAEYAIESLRENRFHFIGSDCHNMDDRRPNIGDAADTIYAAGAAAELELLNQRIESVIKGKS